MKKLILCGTALLFSLGLAKAQGWQTTGAHDDFATSTEYANGSNGEGLVWFGDNVFTITRPGTGILNVAATSAGGAGNYPLFGVNFNDDNGSTAGGTPFVVDLSGGQADIQVDVENNSSQLLFVDIKLVDINDVQTQIEPNISDVLSTTQWGDAPYPRKALNGFTLGPNARKTITIDLSSVPSALGGLTEGAYTCSLPYNCPTTSYLIDPSQIKSVLFRVNFGNSNINLSQGDGDFATDTLINGGDIVAYTGNIKLHDFKIGTAIVAGVTKSTVDGSLMVYPNPAKDALTVSFDAEAGADITLSDITGYKVFSTSASAGANKINVNTSGLSSGVYILNVATENGRVARKVTIQ